MALPDLSRRVDKKLTDSAADGDGGVLVVSRDHDDANAGLDAIFDGRRDFGSRRIQHADQSDESDSGLVIDEFRRILEIHLRLGHRVVDAAESKTAKSVGSGSPSVGHFQDTGFDLWRHCNLSRKRHILRQLPNFFSPDIHLASKSQKHW